MERMWQAIQKGVQSGLALAEQERAKKRTSGAAKQAPGEAVKWYAGDKPTAREALARIYTIGREDSAKGRQLFAQFQALQEDERSPFFSPYRSATNKEAVSALEKLGVDVSGGVDAKWLEKNAALSEDKNAGKWYRALSESEAATQAAESEWEKLQKHLTDSARAGMGDDEILSSIDWNRYGTLAAMDRGMSGASPLALNRPVGYSQDAVYGVLHAARSGKSSGDYLVDAARALLAGQTDSGEDSSTQENFAAQQKPVQHAGENTAQTPARPVSPYTSSQDLARDVRAGLFDRQEEPQQKPDVAAMQARLAEIEKEIAMRTGTPGAALESAFADISFSDWKNRLLGRGSVQENGTQADVYALEDERDALRRELWFAERAEKYGQMQAEADAFARSFSRDATNGDAQYRYINRLDGARDEGLFRNAVSGDEAYARYDYMTDSERAMYNYLYATQGEQAAQEYIEYIGYELDARLTALRSGQAAQMHGAVGSAASVPMSVASGAGALSSIAQGIRNKFSEEYKPINTNTVFNRPGQLAGAIRGGVMERNDWNVGKWDAFDFLYSTIMSGADSLTAGALGGSNLGGALLGGAAAEATMQDIFDRGGTEEQMIAGGVAAGLFEMLGERVSLGQLYDAGKATRSSFGGIVKDIFAQMGINASEEMATELAGGIFDYFNMGEKSQLGQTMAQYRAQGLPEWRVRGKALADMWMGVAEAGASGALMGAGFGALSNASSVGEARLNARFAQESSRQAVLSAAMESGDASVREAASELAGRSDADEASYTALYRAMERAGEVDRQLRQAVYGRGGTTEEAASSPEAVSDASAAGVSSGVSEARRADGSFAVQRRVTASAAQAVSAPVRAAGTLDGTNVTVAGVASADGENVYVRLADGGTARASQVEFSDPEIARLYSLAGKFGEAAQAFVGNYEYASGMDVESYERAFSALYGGGRTGMDEEQAVQTAGLAAQGLPDAIRHIAWQAGVSARSAALSAPAAGKGLNVPAGNAAQHAEGALQSTEDESGVLYDGANTAGGAPRGEESGSGGLVREYRGEPSRKKKRQLDVLDAIGRKYGVEIVVRDSLEGGANGMYEPGKRRIYVSLDAAGEGVALAGMHELGHYIEDWNADAWEVLSAFVLDTLSEKGMDVKKAMRERIAGYKKQGIALTEAEARSEVVCEALPAVLADESACRRLVSENRTLAERIRDFLREFAEHIRSIVRSFGREEARAFLDDAQALGTLADMLDAALAGAKEGTSDGEAGKRVYAIRQGVVLTEEQLEENRWHVAAMEPVHSLSGREFVLGDGKLREKVVEYFESIGGSVENDVLGTVRLSRAGVKSAIAHGIHKAKVMAFHAVPSVLEKGSVIGFEKGWKGRPYDTAVVAAPVRFVEDGREQGYYVGVIVMRDANTQRFYTHDAVAIKKQDGIANKNGDDLPATLPVGNTYPTLFSILQSLNNVNPTGQENNGKIRYSLKGTAEESEKGARAWAAMRKEYASRSGSGLDMGGVRREAGAILREYESKMDGEALSGGIWEIRKAVQAGATFEEAARMADDLAGQVMETSARNNEAMRARYADLRRTLRTEAIRLTDGQKLAAAQMFDSYENFQRAIFGNVRLSEKGDSLAEVWGRLSGEYPEVFRFDTAERDMPQALWEFVEATRPGYKSAEGMLAGEDAAILASRILDGAAGLPASGQMAQAVRDGAALRQGQARKESIARMQEIGRQLRTIGNRNSAEYRALFAKYKREFARGDREAYQAARVLAEENWRRQRDRHRDTEARAKYRERIEKDAKALLTALSKPTHQKHIPGFMQESVHALLDSLDMSGRNGRQTQKGTRWRDALSTVTQQMTDAYNAQSGGFVVDDARFAGFMATISERQLQTMHEALSHLESDLAIADMTAEQLRVLSETIAIVRHTVAEVDRLWGSARYQTAAEAGEATVEELMQRKEATIDRRNSAIRRMAEFLNLDELDFFRFIERTGAAGKAIFSELYDGFKKSVLRVREGQAYFARLKKEIGLTTREMRAWTEKKQAIELSDKRKVEMSAAEIMELYLLSRRPQGLSHLLGGGMRLRDSKRAVKLTQADIDAITGKLTDKQRAAADGMQAFLRDNTAAWGNEVTKVLYLYEQFAESHYWPVKSDSNYTVTKEATGTDDLNAVRHSSFTKALTPGANNPAVVGDAFATFTDHIAMAATYNGMAIPLEDALKWLNYVSRDENGTMVGSVKESIEHALGRGGVRYITNLLRDINGLSRAGNGAGLDLSGVWKKAAVMGKLSVVIQQPTSLLRAAAEINPLYLLSGMTPVRGTIREMQERSATAWWKAQGNYDIQAGKSMRTLLLGDGSPIDAYTEKLMSAAGKMDDLSWAVIWRACKKEAKLRYHLKPGTDAYWQRVEARFDEIVNKTQVIDTVFHRSQLMRDTNGLNRMATAFMGEPTKVVNMFAGALWDLVHAPNKKAAAKKLGVVTMAVAASTLLNDAVKALYFAIKNREEDEPLDEAYLDYLQGYLKDDINPLNYIPYLKDVSAIVGGDTLERNDLSAVSSAWQAVNTAYNYLFGGNTKKRSLYGAFAPLIATGADLLGLGGSGIKANLEFAVNLVKPGFLTYTAETAKAEDAYGVLYDYMLAGEMEKAAALREKLRGGMEGVLPDTDEAQKAGLHGSVPKSDKEIDRGLAYILAERDDRIARMAEIRDSGRNVAGFYALEKEIMQSGFTEETVVAAVNRYKDMAGYVKQQKDLDEQLTARTFDYKDLQAAILNGSVEDVQLVYEYVLEYSEADDPAKSARTQLTKLFKPMWPDMTPSQRSMVEKRLVEIAGYKEDSIDKWEE